MLSQFLHLLLGGLNGCFELAVLLHPLLVLPALRGKLLLILGLLLGENCKTLKGFAEVTGGAHIEQRHLWPKGLLLRDVEGLLLCAMLVILQRLTLWHRLHLRLLHVLGNRGLCQSGQGRAKALAVQALLLALPCRIFLLGAAQLLDERALREAGHHVSVLLQGELLGPLGAPELVLQVCETLDIDDAAVIRREAAELALCLWRYFATLSLQDTPCKVHHLIVVVQASNDLVTSLRERSKGACPPRSGNPFLHQSEILHRLRPCRGAELFLEPRQGLDALGAAVVWNKTTKLGGSIPH
mmetsp:Transcript_50772/g.110176  ORF Transcript_50772/g.110176 Transcript_50772/m.110176 type:complete len:298 (+) Transcript_50772:635-1528(+)